MEISPQETPHCRKTRANQRGRSEEKTYSNVPSRDVPTIFKTRRNSVTAVSSTITWWILPSGGYWNKKYAFLAKEFKTVLSRYADSLENRTKKRYIEKISVIGIDPSVISQQKYISECLPPVEACDLPSYLVLETSFYMKDLFKNFWSLLAYSHMVSGPITGVFGQIVREKYVVLAKVRHSQRMNDPRMQLWIITTKQGSCCFRSLCGMYGWAGRMPFSYCECSFYLEIWTRMNEKLACIQVKCTWLLQGLTL